VADGISADAFNGLIGQTFTILGPESRLEAQLVEVTPHGNGASIVFRGPREPVLPQRIYAFEHAGLGAFEIFIVPIGPDDAGMRYEAVFN
jgi:hypothetical protein